jgi:hypothetical protein
MRALAALRMVWASAVWMAVEMLATWCVRKLWGDARVISQSTGATHPGKVKRRSGGPPRPPPPLRGSRGLRAPMVIPNFDTILTNISTDSHDISTLPVYR